MPVDEQVAHRANVQQATMQAQHASGTPGGAQAGVTERTPQIVTGPFIRILRTPLFAFFVPLYSHSSYPLLRVWTQVTRQEGRLPSVSGGIGGFSDMGDDSLRRGTEINRTSTGFSWEVFVRARVHACVRE
jgi:hypothetical protein